MILNAIAEKLKRQSKDDFKGRQAWLIIQAVAWYLRYPLSCRVRSAGSKQSMPIMINTTSLLGTVVMRTPSHEASPLQRRHVSGQE